MTHPTRYHPGLVTLLEIGVMFLPAIPAYLWVWPHVTSENSYLVNSIAYLYVLAGTLWIGLRRLSLQELGINGNGLSLSLMSGMFIIAGRTFVILAMDWEIAPRPFNLPRLLGEVLFYFGLVGVVEELLFRGLLYHTLDKWRNTTWAIWGSSLGFLLWHIFGQGPLIGLAAFFYGLIFALMRWRAGGIIGLIFIHGLMDLASVEMLPSSDIVGLGLPVVSHPFLLLLGCVLILIVPLYLWLLHPIALKMIKTIWINKRLTITQVDKNL